MNVSIFARAIAFIALGWLILTSGLTLTHGHLASPRSAEPAIPLDLLALDLLRCAELGSQATADPGCKAAWAQSGQRFLRTGEWQEFLLVLQSGRQPIGQIT